MNARFYRAEYRNLSPFTPGGVIRVFQGRENAVAWLRSFGKSQYNRFFINGEAVEI